MSFLCLSVSLTVLPLLFKAFFAQVGFCRSGNFAQVDYCPRAFLSKWYFCQSGIIHGHFMGISTYYCKQTLFLLITYCWHNSGKQFPDENAEKQLTLPHLLINFGKVLIFSLIIIAEFCKIFTPGCSWTGPNIGSQLNLSNRYLVMWWIVSKVPSPNRTYTNSLVVLYLLYL